MCLTIPKQVVSATKEAVILKSGRKNETAGSLLAVKKGDWVLTQNRVVIRKITARQAREINKYILTA